MNKRHFITIGLAATLGLFTNCALLDKNAPQDAKLRDLRVACYSAASIGTAIALEQNKELQPQFEVAYASLNTLVENKIVTGLALRQIILSLPVHELKSPNARIAIDGAAYLWDATVGDRVNIELTPYLNAAAMGLRDGMKAALNK